MKNITITVPQSLENDLLALADHFCSNRASVIRLAIKRLAQQELATKRPPRTNTKGAA